MIVLNLTSGEDFLDLSLVAQTPEDRDIIEKIKTENKHVYARVDKSTGVEINYLCFHFGLGLAKPVKPE